jgi:hypothetical protein
MTNTAGTIPPDAVRVWRGYRAASTTLEQFYSLLGTVFIPATVEMQVQIGLDCYLPTVPAGMPDKPSTVPDETAILFWDSQAAWANGFNTLAVRTYTLTHTGVYDMTVSGAQFPVLFAGTLAKEQPYYLVNKPADWMRGGSVSQYLAARPADVGWPQAVTPDAFRAAYATVLSALQTAGKLDGAVACAGDEYFVFWGLGDAAADAVKQLQAAAKTGWANTFTPAATELPAQLWDTWPGLPVPAGAAFNMSYPRPWESS